MKRLGFRGRLFVILLSFALIPSVLLSVAWGATSWWALPLVGSTAAWDSAASTGHRAITVARRASGGLTPAERKALDAHEQVLNVSLTRAVQARFIFRRVAIAFAVLSIASFLLLGLGASRVAGHLSRLLSRPLQELVGWTSLIARGDPLPAEQQARGAPEFATLREQMRLMASEIELGRAQALEAGRAAAMRETARQVAHELKNPLTPIRFAVSRMKREAPPSLADAVEVLEVETKRLEELARSFAQFGKLPEGPMAEIDVGELLRYTARASVPDGVVLDIEVEDGLPMLHGHHDALARALSNVVLNAVDACRGRDNAHVSVSARRTRAQGRDELELTVADTGCGIAPEQVARIWEPYVTHKPGGTGLGLAIARQAVLAHHGRVSAESTKGEGTRISFAFPLTNPNGDAGA
ncbi:MAG: hypothetical protein JWO05_615 [Gemmatimonadetes bacterium]|nr:hypothetical protein [Gemmatimonadota bacterium]